MIAIAVVFIGVQCVALWIILYFARQFGAYTTELKRMHRENLILQRSQARMAERLIEAQTTTKERSA